MWYFLIKNSINHNFAFENCIFNWNLLILSIWMNSDYYWFGNEYPNKIGAN